MKKTRLAIVPVRTSRPDVAPELARQLAALNRFDVLDPEKVSAFLKDKQQGGPHWSRDGHAERQSIMNLKAADQRTEPRVAVQFHAMVSGSVQSEGTGIILDLSRRGCRLESPLLMLPGLSLELRIAVPGLEWALMIDGADVQWTNEDRAGLAFVRMRETERQRLDDVMTARLARTPEDGDEKQAELVPVEFQGLEPVLSKNPEVAVSKGLAWFAQDRGEFPFRGGSLLNRAFPTCAPDLAAALGRLVQSGGDTEIDFSLALLQNYRGSASADGVLKEHMVRSADGSCHERRIENFFAGRR